MIPLVPMVALLACSPSPVAELEEALGRSLDPLERAQLPERGVALVVHPDRLQVVGFGWVDAPEEALPGPSAPIAIDADGMVQKKRGQLMEDLYDELLAWSSMWRARQDQDGFRGDLWLFVDRRTQGHTFREVLFTSGQAMFGNLHSIPIGPRMAPEEPLVPPPTGIPDETRRRSPLDPVRIGIVDGSEGYVVDDRLATIRVDTLRGDEDRVVVDGASAMDFLRHEPGDPVLYPTYTAAAAAATYPVLPSVEMLMHVSKDLDDALMAELQHAREPVRRDWVERAIGAAVDLPEARAWLEVARALGRGEEPQGARDFLDDPLRSHPIGIYGEDEALGHIYRRDRWLSQTLPRDDRLRAQLKAVLEDPRVAPGLKAERVHRAVWTNPASHRTVEEGGSYVLSPARNHEQLWIDAQGGTLAVPDPMEAWVDAIVAGATDLGLGDGSGWYDHQQWALEPLLTLPDDYEVGDGYRKRLREAFMVGVALRRETQVKDLTLPSIGAGMSDVVDANIAPELRVEPVPTHFERSAASYRWLARAALSRGEVEAATWGPRVEEMAVLYDGLATISRVDLGLVPGGATGTSVVSDEEGGPQVKLSGELLGHVPGLGDDDPTEAPSPRPAPEVEPPRLDGQKAQDWLERWAEHPVLAEDVRLMVPGGETPDGRTIGWAVLGVRPVDLTVTYVEPPAVTSLREDVEVRVHTVEARYTVLAPYFTEVEMPAPLDRATFRRLADQHPRAGALIEALAR